MKIFVNDEVVVEGNLNGFTNPAIEAGLVHCRALLEFLGLCMTSGRRLGNRKKRRNSDIDIEHFQNASGYLSMVTPDDALKFYKGPPTDVEEALLTVFETTNKGIAHSTSDFNAHPEHARLAEIASRGIPPLVVSHLYTPLGLAAPDYKITGRPRG
ncbi:MAG TPA: hypothetical protein VFI94_02600 [Pseudolabrys sp.]|nr:hypothetical protein [Pseudolabrys sp.]